MTKVATANGYDYYVGVDHICGKYYNIVPEGSKSPNGGYYGKEFILGIKNVPDMFG